MRSVVTDTQLTNRLLRNGYKFPDECKLVKIRHGVGEGPVEVMFVCNMTAEFAAAYGQAMLDCVEENADARG